MARLKSDEKRHAILAAATRVIAAHGLGAPTALIAKEAGISNGSLFTYFETKAELLNQLYIELKTEMGTAAFDAFPSENSPREQLRHVWTNWLHWAVTDPKKRRTLAHLSVSDEITAGSHQAAALAFGEIAALVDRCRSGGPMRTAPLSLVLTIMSGVADAAMDYMLRDPANADAHCETAFEAAWRMIE